MDLRDSCRHVCGAGVFTPGGSHGPRHGAVAQGHVLPCRGSQLPLLGRLLSYGRFVEARFGFFPPLTPRRLLSEPSQAKRWLVLLRSARKLSSASVGDGKKDGPAFCGGCTLALVSAGLSPFLLQMISALHPALFQTSSGPGRPRAMLSVRVRGVPLAAQRVFQKSEGLYPPWDGSKRSSHGNKKRFFAGIRRHPNAHRDVRHARPTARAARGVEGGVTRGPRRLGQLQAAPRVKSDDRGHARR